MNWKLPKYVLKKYLAYKVIGGEVKQYVLDEVGQEDRDVDEEHIVVHVGTSDSGMFDNNTFYNIWGIDRGSFERMERGREYVRERGFVLLELEKNLYDEVVGANCRIKDAYKDIGVIIEHLLEE